MKQQFLDEEYNWVLKDYKELKEKPLNEQQRKNEVSNILNHIQNVKNVIDAYRITKRTTRLRLPYKKPFKEDNNEI